MFAGNMARPQTLGLAIRLWGSFPPYKRKCRLLQSEMLLQISQNLPLKYRTWLLQVTPWLGVQISLMDHQVSLPQVHP